MATTTTPLTPSQITTLKSTIPLIATHGQTVTSKFYATLLQDNPSLTNIFNATHQATGHQARALAGALLAYASNIDNLGALAPAVELICHKHASLGVTPEQYGVVGTYLLATMKEVMGSAATDEVMDAWGAAYWQLANLMIAREKALYESAGRWSEWQDVRIVRKEKEAGDITSFYFEPVDAGLEVPLFKPGQYVSVNVFVDELNGGTWQARQYSLSDAPGKSYLRISVKREAGVEVGEPAHMTHPGYISNLLHDKKEVGDVVRMTHPFGDFFFDGEAVAPDAPVVLISAGVGLTCLTSILNAVIEKGDSRPISWIHGARDGRARAFKKSIDAVAAAKPNLQTLYFSSAPGSTEVQGQDYHVQGRLALNKVDPHMLHTDNSSTLYFVCGPTQFMLDVEAELKSNGVGASRINMELFGTGGVPRV